MIYSQGAVCFYMKGIFRMGCSLVEKEICELLFVCRLICILVVLASTPLSQRWTPLSQRWTPLSLCSGVFHGIVFLNLNSKGMKKLLFFGILLFSLSACSTSKKANDGWISLFDGKSLSGWKVNENPETFSVVDGAIVANGPRSHLFYNGPVANHNFKNFEFKATVMTMPGSNSGIYFHTEYLDQGWPAKGYEVQVNNTHTDWRKTGGLYAIVDVREAPANDNEWFTEHIIVQGKNVTVKVNGKTTVEYTEPDNPDRPENMSQRLISSGTFALQGHDPGSKVLYKEVMVKILPD